MDWRKFLKQLNPAAYERVKCDPCDGTGFELVNGKPWQHRGRFVNCQKCHGRGWNLFRKESD